MAHKVKVKWETEVYDRSGLGSRGPGEEAAGWQCDGTHIWAAQTDIRPALKFVVVREKSLFCHKMHFLSGSLRTGPESVVYMKLWWHSPKSAPLFQWTVITESTSVTILLPFDCFNVVLPPLRNDIADTKLTTSIQLWWSKYCFFQLLFERE